MAQKSTAQDSQDNIMIEEETAGTGTDTSGDVTILASYNKSTKLVKFYSHESLCEKLHTIFEIPPEEKLLIQEYNNEWDCFIDVGDLKNIKNKSKIQIVSVGVVKQNATLKSRPIRSLQDDNQSTSSSCDTSDDISFLSQSFNLSESDSSPIAWTEEKIDTKQFSTELKTKLFKGERLNWATQHEFMNIIESLIFTHTFYPKPDEINCLCRNLLSQFPSLREQIGGGYDALKQRIINKLKNSRRPMKSPDVLIKKRKAESKKTSGRLRILNFEDKGIKNWSPDPGDIPDVSLSEELTSECTKTYGKDVEKIKELTKLSFCERRTMINSGAKVPDILQKYQSLRNPDEQILEFERLTEKTNSMTDFVENVNKYASGTLKIASSKAKTTEFVQFQINKSSDFNETSEAIQREHIAVSAVNLIPLLLGSKRNLIIEEYPETASVDDILNGPASPSPYIASIGDTHSSKNFYIVIESTIVSHAHRFIDAVYYFFINFYIFNIEYTKKAELFYQYLQLCLFKIDTRSKPPSKIINFFEKLQEIKNNA